MQQIHFFSYGCGMFYCVTNTFTAKCFLQN